MAEKSKVCSKCAKCKPLDDFYACTTGIQGVMPYCKTCDNTRERKPNGTKLNRMRARHRAIADLIAWHPDEFASLLEIRLAEATEEAEALAATPQAAQHYQDSPVKLRPGKRMPGETTVDRIDVARCPSCIDHHDRGHRCTECGASPQGVARTDGVA